MGFTFYEQQENSFDNVPAGKYEVKIDKAMLRTARTGTQYISLQCRIREDVKQKFQKRVVFFSMFKKKEPTKDDLLTEGFSFAYLGMLWNRSGLAKGEKTFKNLDELLKLFEGCNFIAKVDDEGRVSDLMTSSVSTTVEDLIDEEDLPW